VQKVRARGQLHISNLDATLRALSKMPKEASAQLRQESQQLAGDIVRNAQARASTPGQQLAARQMRARRDRVPVIVAGGSKRLPVTSSRKSRKGDRQTYGDIFFGYEFGGSRGSIAAMGGAGKGQQLAYTSRRRVRYSTFHARTSQFPPHRGREGYFLYPTIRSMNHEIGQRYFDALDRALVKAGAH
jgi:hypothetical protein